MVSKTSPIGFWNSIDDPQMVGRMAGSVDFVLIDLEHGFRDFSRITQMVFAVGAARSEAIVRLRSWDDSLLQALLDLGVTKFLVPGIERAEQVHRLVERTRWAPNGMRGFHPRSPHDPSHSLETEVEIFPIIETPAALEDLSAILGIDGVCGCYFGTYDLAQALGVRRDSEVITSKFRVLGEGLVQEKKSLMFMPSSATAPGTFGEELAELHVIGIDTEILMDGLQKRVNMNLADAQ